MIENNQIKEDGCKHIIQAKWEQLKRIDLCKNAFKAAFNIVKPKGCYHLSQKEF